MNITLTPSVLFQDENIIVVDKPAGMVVNKADSAKGAVTLQEWVEENIKDQISNFKNREDYMIAGYNKFDEFMSRSGIVHRLDKETSGIILIAKTVEAFIDLQNQFKSGTVKKTYRALVHGKLEREGEINGAIGRLPWNRMRFGILLEGRASQTFYKVLQYKEYEKEILSFVEVYPKTGRTHQIRVHFQHIQHPIFADGLYAGRKAGSADRKVLPRHFLHAYKIELKHPVSKKDLEFISPLPFDLEKFLDSLTPVDFPFPNPVH